MKENTYKPQIPDIMEAIFDAAYLTFDLVTAILFFIYAKGSTLFVLYGILTLTLCGGDAFHLVPRIIRAVRGTSDKIKRQLGIGLQVSSITMTVFYIILMYIWKLTFPEITMPAAIEAIVWISAVVRIVICLFPQNNWCTDEGNMKLSIIRNAVFAVTGIGVIILYAISGNANGYHMTGTGWKTIVYQPVPDSIIYLRYLHQLQIESASSEYHSCPGYQFPRASDLRQYYRFCQGVWL